MTLLGEVLSLFDKEFMEDKVEELSDHMYRVSCGLLASDADRQDAIQAALLKAWIKRGSLREIDSFDAWIIRILIHECRNIGRSLRREIAVDTLPETCAEMPDHSVREAVDGLPEKQRICVVLHYMEGLPLREVARILRLPHSTVRGRLMQARKSLRLEMEDEYEN